MTHKEAQTEPETLDPGRLEARLSLAALRRRMFGRAAPVQVGRYRLDGLLGRGAHGSVFETLDTALDRPVALKVLRARPGTEAQRQRAQQRLLREAQALAQLSHPNVVQVYAAETIAGQVWIAMELVRGTTLAGWAVDHTDFTPDRFERARHLLREAGQGLVSAHSRGLVHRDFKPANVLVGDDGRVCVADFGLARSRAPTIDLDPNAPAGNGGHTVGVGTPHYMSPEQLRGDPITAASDQFNYAATAWELVYGVHPYSIADRSTRLAEIEAGQIHTVEGRSVPSHYAAALRRALSERPIDRFGTMHALLRALGHRPRRRRRRLAVVAGLGAAAVTLGLFGPTADAGPTCTREAAGEMVSEVWSAEREQAVIVGLHQSGIDDPSLLARRVGTVLDDYMTDWRDVLVDTCEARWHKDTLDDAAFDARMACLRHGLHQADEMLVRLEEGDSLAGVRAMSAAASLSPASACNDDDELWADQSPLAAKLRRRLVHAEAALVAGRYDEAIETAQQVLDGAHAHDMTAISRRALMTQGTAYGELDDERRFAALEEAYYLAAQLDDHEAIAESAVALSIQYAYRHDPDTAEQWLRHGEAAIGRTGTGPSYDYELARGLIAQHNGRHDEARAILEGILASAGDLPPTAADALWLASARLVLLELNAGELDRATTRLTELQRATAENLGPSHPRMSRLWLMQGRVHETMGDEPAGVAAIERGIELAQLGYGDISVRTATTKLVLGWHMHQRDRFDEAERLYEGALRSSGGQKSVFAVRALRGLARIHGDRSEHEQAVDYMQRAVAIGRELWGDDHRELINCRQHLAEFLRAAGREQEALAQLRLTKPVGAPE